ncbi:MAG: (Fe-S)-binding protein [Streptosporangiales bacterium]|nr:(Fe-S)-binding protein [Streptosporangiales bacterium]
MRIVLFAPCFDDTLLPATPQAVVRLLERLGHEVIYPEAQTCCGQWHLAAGYRREAAALSRRFTDVFTAAAARADAIVTPSASCAVTVRRADPDLAVHELSELLVDVLGVTDVGAEFPHRVAYHPTCHALRGLRAGDRPLTLLRAVRGLELVPFGRAEECCGFGGPFAMKNADTSVALVADKVGHLTESGAEVVCAVDDGCLLHIGGAMSRLRSGLRVMHLAEILATPAGGPT